MIGAFLDLCTVVGAIVIGCVIGGVAWFVVESLSDRRGRRRRGARAELTINAVRVLNHRGEPVSRATIDELMPRVVEVEP